MWLIYQANLNFFKIKMTGFNFISIQKLFKIIKNMFTTFILNAKLSNKKKSIQRNALL
jgi:hypothetical protein